MSHRRGTTAGQKDATAVGAEEMIPFRQNLDGAPTVESARSVVKVPVSIGMEERSAADILAAKQQDWISGSFATGMYETSWHSEYAKFKANPYQQCMQSTGPDGAACNCCSAVVCGMIGADRIGHMAVLKQSMELVEEVVDEGDGCEPTVRRYKRPKLDIVIGPYWPMLFCVTYPLIFGVSAVTLVTAVPYCNPFIQLLWAVTTLGLIYALAMTAFKDPGILPRHLEPPPNSDSSWRWSDRAYSFRPRGAYFDPDTGVIVEGFDHTCPWTGTAIGKKNMPAFQSFVGLIFFCLMFDIILITGGVRSIWCPWTGGPIAKNNKQWFFIFLGFFYSTLLIDTVLLSQYFFRGRFEVMEEEEL